MSLPFLFRGDLSCLVYAPCAAAARLRLQRWIISCPRGACASEDALAYTVNSGEIEGVELPVLRAVREHSDEFCCTRWREGQARFHRGGCISAVSGRRRRNFLNRGDYWYPGQKEQRCENMWAARGNIPRAMNGKVSGPSLGCLVGGDCEGPWMPHTKDGLYLSRDSQRSRWSHLPVR